MALRNMVVQRTAQFVLMLDGLKFEQKQKISELGFGCLFKLQPILVNRSLIETLSRAYQPDSKTFKIGEKSVSLTNWDAYCIMGLRDEGTHIDFERKIINEALLEIFENPTHQHISFLDLNSRISTFDANDENFVRVFVLLMVAGVLAQPTDDRIPWEYLNIVEDVDQVSNFNWAEFTVSFLHRSLMRNKYTKMRLEGNLILLQLWYYEHVQEITVNKNLDHHYPLMSKWTRELMDKRDKYERKHGRFHGNIVQRLNLSEIQLDRDDVGESFELKIISKEQWISTHSKTIIKNESIQQLPTKTPEKTIEKKNTRVNMISDHRDDESEQHKSKRMKQSRPKEQERDPYGSIRVNKDISRVELSKNEMAAVEYVRNIESSTEVVKMNGGFGFLTLTAGDMNCLIQPTYETGQSKWLNDEVINCGINIMDPTRHAVIQVMTVDTHNTQIYARTNLKATTYPLDLMRWAKTGKEFLKNNLVFFPINYKNTHWYVGVLNFNKKMFQILDSSCKPPSCYPELTLNLRNGIQFLISLALDTDNLLQIEYLDLDITTWPVVVIDVPQQKDDHSCGLFALKFIELWKGYNEFSMSMKVDAEDAELYRKQLVYKLIINEKNTLEEVQKDFWDRVLSPEEYK